MIYNTTDADGNTNTDGIRSNNVWDAQNRLSQCTTATQGVTTFTYGADGLRRQKSNALAGVTTVTDSVLDNGMLVQERNVTASTSATYLVGLRGPECRRDDQTQMMRWYLYDGLGSVLGEVAPTGAVMSSRSLDVYGKARSTAIASGEHPSKQAFVGSLGHTTDEETGGLVYMRARYMDATTGRFISQDPAKNGINWFVYCDNNPINAVDSSGQSAFWLFLGKILETLGWEGVKSYIYSLIDPTNMLGLGTQGVDPLEIAKDFILDKIKHHVAASREGATKMKKAQGKEEATDGVLYEDEAIAAGDTVSSVKSLANDIEELDVLNFLIGCGGE